MFIFRHVVFYLDSVCNFAPYFVEREQPDNTIPPREFYGGHFGTPPLNFLRNAEDGDIRIIFDLRYTGPG